MESDDAFSPDSLPEPLHSYAKQVLTSRISLSAKYDTLETQLRSHLLDLATTTKQCIWDMSKLQAYWIWCWKLCVYLVTNSDLEHFVRKLPFVLLEDLVDTLSTDHLEQFWEATILSQRDSSSTTATTVTTMTLCSGILWENPSGTNNSHVLQWIRLCNALLQKQRTAQWTGRILLDLLAAVLPLNDRSALKLWGSVSSTGQDDSKYYCQEEDEYQQDVKRETDDDNVNNKDGTDVTSSISKMLPFSFYETFWSVQRDFRNPYAISFGKFFQTMRTILAALEGKTVVTPSTNATMTDTAKYLTRGRLLPLQLQDPTFQWHILTQFLIVESFVSSQSSQLQATLQDLTRRAKALLQKHPLTGSSENQLPTLEWILSERESMWRQWKKNKCQPDMVKTMPPIMNKDGPPPSHSGNGTIKQLPNVDIVEMKLTMDDLAVISQDMGKAVPNVYDYLEDYVDALDPDAGIEPDYHPKNDKLFSWRALRLLSRDHLNQFGMIRKSNGDFERMIRHIYKEEKGRDIAGQCPDNDDEIDDDDTPAIDNEPIADPMTEEAADTEGEEGAIAEPMESTELLENDTEEPQEESSSSPGSTSPEQKEADQAEVGEVEDCQAPSDQHGDANTPQVVDMKELSDFERAALEEEAELLRLGEAQETTQKGDQAILPNDATGLNADKNEISGDDTQPAVTTEEVQQSGADQRKRRRSRSNSQTRGDRNRHRGNDRVGGGTQGASNAIQGAVGDGSNNRPSRDIHKRGRHGPGNRSNDDIPNHGAIIINTEGREILTAPRNDARRQDGHGAQGINSRRGANELGGRRSEGRYNDRRGRGSGGDDGARRRGR